MAIVKGASRREQEIKDLCMHNVHAYSSLEKLMADHRCMAIQGRQHLISATHGFQRKRRKFFDLHCPLSMWECFHNEKKPKR